MNIYQIEITDTFGGESNYAWVKRYKFTANDSRLSLIRAAKKIAGYSGHPCKVSDYGDSIELRPRGQCIVMFITQDVG